jgi:hypothetical protein
MTMDNDSWPWIVVVDADDVTVVGPFPTSAEAKEWVVASSDSDWDSPDGWHRAGLHVHQLNPPSYLDDEVDDDD